LSGTALLPDFLYISPFLVLWPGKCLGAHKQAWFPSQMRSVKPSHNGAEARVLLQSRSCRPGWLRPAPALC